MADANRAGMKPSMIGSSVRLHHDARENAPDVKTCRECGQAKPTGEFSKDARTRDGLHSSYCKPCASAQSRERYHANAAKVRARTRAYRRAKAEKVRAQRRGRSASRVRFLQSVKLTAGCIDCGYADNPERLHFDHRSGTVKLFNVGTGRLNSWARLQTEIEKCDVRCDSCHLKRHHKEGRERGPDGRLAPMGGAS